MRWTLFDQYLMYVSPTVKLLRAIDRDFDARMRRIERDHDKYIEKKRRNAYASISQSSRET